MVHGSWFRVKGSELRGDLLGQNAVEKRRTTCAKGRALDVYQYRNPSLISTHTLWQPLHLNPNHACTKILPEAESCFNTNTPAMYLPPPKRQILKSAQASTSPLRFFLASASRALPTYPLIPQPERPSTFSHQARVQRGVAKGQFPLKGSGFQKWIS